MKKSHSFDELSKKPCIDCGKFLKLRIVEEKPNAERCFDCHKEHERKRGHLMK